MKKITIAAIGVGTVILLAGGGYGIFRVVKNNASPVEVTKVSSLNTGWWGDSSSTSGVITANATQEVYLDSDELVDEVHVQEGDEVKIGDKLLSYDTTLLEIDLEAEKLERQSIRLQIQSAKQELEKLNKITPVSDNYYGDAGKADGAVLVKTAAVMTATSEPADTGASQTETQAPETQAPETQAPETQAPETQAPQTQAPETQAPETQAPQTESQMPETVSEEMLNPGGGTTEETEKSPLSQVKAYSKLNYDSKPYKGSGTKDDPYVFFCKEGTTIYASFMNKMLGYNEAGTSKSKGGMNKDGKGSYAILEIREGDSVNGGFVKSISINGTAKVDKAYAPDITWTFGSDGVTKNVPEVDEPSDDEDPFGDDWGDDWGGDWGDDVYTATELKEAIKEKEDEIKDLRLDLREAKLKVKQAQRKLDEATVKATINGVVKSVGDPAAELDGEPFLTVTSSEGMYVKGTISELKLGDVQVGSTMTGMSYESGMSFTAEITEISEYPTTADSWYSGQAEASVYPFMAYIEDSDGLTNNEWVDLTIQESDVDSSAIYLYKAYIRSENGQSYVYKADEDNRLVKQYIKTGATLYSMYVEVKGGLSLEDRIAFPYGKNVAEGAKVKDSDGTDDAMLY